MGNPSASTPSKFDRSDTVGWEFIPMADYAVPTFAGLGAAVKKW